MLRSLKVKFLKLTLTTLTWLEKATLSLRFKLIVICVAKHDSSQSLIKNIGETWKRKAPNSLQSNPANVSHPG